MNSRLVAAGILSRVVKDGVSLTAALDHALPQIDQFKDKAFVQALCYGVLRWYQQLEYILAQLLHKPIKDVDIKLLALLGLYQLRFMRVKTYAAVSETVSAIPKKKAWARPLLNAILRKYLREQEGLVASLESDEAAAYSHPQWLYDFFKANWPDQFEQLMTANNLPPPMTLRINKQHGSREQYAQKLAGQGISSYSHPNCPSALVLEQAVPVEQLPGFSDGLVFVQDAAAQLAAELLDLQPSHRVLDVCAAPGGKTTHILELQPELEQLTALDIDAIRLQRVAENLQRLTLNAQLLTGDACHPEHWWDGQLYDRILLDAPCSATGVIRRHPDIKMLRKPEDIDHLVIVQKRILEACWGLLRPGGMLLYATCSILQKENEKQVKLFIESHEDAVDSAIDASWGYQRQYGRQVFPGEQDMDGFYYARINKV